MPERAVALVSLPAAIILQVVSIPAYTDITALTYTHWSVSQPYSSALSSSNADRVFL
jgi:hypothetical protein